MKKLSIIAAILFFAVSTVFAAPFAPTVLKISAPSHILYNFDGKSLSVPVTVTGTPASISFLVFTQGKGASIGTVQNGYLGWHYVNKIDTCLFFSKMQQLSKGSNTIEWDGKDQDGGIVPIDTYTYYLYAYDSVTPKLKMSQSVSLGWESRSTIQERDNKGVVLAQPIFWDTPCVNMEQHPTAEVQTNRGKWIIGNDPEDATLRESCTYMTLVENSSIAIDVDNPRLFYTQHLINDTGKLVMRKMEWVPNGEAVLQTNWADNGLLIYETDIVGGWGYMSGPISDGADYLFATDAGISGPVSMSDVVVIDRVDGSVIRKIDISRWWTDMNDGGDTGGGQYTGGPSDLQFRNGLLIANSHSSCVDQMLDPYKDDEETATLWVNQNGDYTGDHNFEESAMHPWLCNDYNVGPYKYFEDVDANGFCFFPAFDMGAVSYGLYAPDGTGMGYHALSGETAGFKSGYRFCDSGCQYDGIYGDNNSAASNTAGVWYVGHDSIKGTISNQVGVADAAPAAFTVSQNSPNPFNPATTITFTLAKAGKTTVDVYNAAGQKIDTPVNSSLSAGSHSVTWNAGKFSAGVYFYTVKSGNFSKTMKMTLLK